MSLQDFSDNLSTLVYVSPSRIPAWLFDKKDKSFLGRTFLSWVKILIYYCVYYAMLAGFFMGMLAVFLMFSVPAQYPMRTGYQSLLKFQPGIGIRPIIDETKTLIYFSKKDPQIYYEYVDNLNALLSYYEEIGQKPAQGFAKCDAKKKEPNLPSKTCRFDLDQLGPCNKKNDFGYPTNKPCVMIKINRVYGWMPDVEDTANPHVFVDCKGQNPEDNVNLGTIKFYPSTPVNGTEVGVFNNNFFPFLGQNGYTSPLVAVQFENVTRHLLVMVECKLSGANNIDPNPVTFEIMID